MEKFLDCRIPVEDGKSDKDVKPILLHSKYYFAGESLRYMFVLKTEVIMSLESALSEVLDLGAYIR